MKTSRLLDIPCYMFDCNGRLRPSSFFDIAQETAAEDSVANGVSDADLAGYGIVWIIARMTVRFNRYPKRWDKVTVQTWHKRMDGLFFLRDYRMLAQDGGELASATSSWVLMNPEQRSIVRPDKLPDILRNGKDSSDDAIVETSPKIIVPRNLPLEKAAGHSVSYSDLDYNGHVNNAKYPVWALDSLPPEWTMHREVKEISINFNHEVTVPDLVEIFRIRNGNTWYVEGICQGKGQVFICEIKF